MSKFLAYLMRVSLHACALLAATVALSAPANAQDLTLPTITVSPAAGTYPTGTMTVTITWSDNQSLNASSRIITFGSDDVTSAFSYSTTGAASAVSTGTVTLQVGSNSLLAYICDSSPDGPNCRTRITTFTVPDPSVRVSADTSALDVPASTGAVTRYRVVNTGISTTVFTMIPTCPGAFGTCTPSASTVTLAAGDSTRVDLSFTAPSSGSGWIQLSAASGSVSDFGGTTVTVQAGADPGFPGDAQSLERIERDACIVISMGPGAASECGDLRIAHALPSTRVLNKARTPVLTYNSDHARPHPIVAEHLAGPAGTVPDSIRAVLTVNGTQVATQDWKGWGSAQTRRLAISFDASTLPTGLYPYTLQVSAVTGGSQATLKTRTGRMIIINRSASPFGAGWWMAGVEQVISLPGDTLKLWVGGDGSARLYHGAVNGPWHADAYDRPDSLFRGTRGGASNVYVRTLPGRSEVWYDAQGRHWRTVNPLGQYTEFRWDNTSTYLVQLVAPHANVAHDTTRYELEYNNNPLATVRNLSRVAAPGIGGARNTDLRTDATGRVLRIREPSTDSITFGYVSGQKWINRRTNRLGVNQTFGYTGVRFRTAAHPLNATQTATPAVLAVVTQGMNGNSVSMDSVRHIFDGPRPGAEVCDCAWWRVNRYGAPIYMRDALWNETTIQRGDARWPALVTKTVAPTGFTTTATYDARGNVTSTTAWNPYGDGRNSTTSYAWDDKWDRPTKVVAPEGEVSLTAYDPTYGQRLWDQVGMDSVRRVRYTYNAPSHSTAPGLPVSVILPGGATEEFEYDTRGNLSATESPLGFRTETLSDAIGRVLRTRQPAYDTTAVAGWRSDTLTYDAADRVTRTVTSGPATSRSPALSLVVANEYDAESRVLLVSRWSVPDTANVDTITTRWVYDLAGRSIVEIAPDGTSGNLTDNPRDSTVYDLAGNVIAVYSRRYADTGSPGHFSTPVTMQYDAMNRLIKRRIPSVLYEPRDEGIPDYSFIDAWGTSTNGPYPWYPNEPGGGYLIAADSALYAYGTLGGMTQADNGDARVRRSYYPGGALKTDTLIIRTEATVANGGNWTSHVYGLRHAYDRNGRRVDLTHPHQLAPRSYGGDVLDHTLWAYDRATGALASVTDPLGAELGFSYNARGELYQITRPTGVAQRYRYDADGRMTTDSVFRGTNTATPAVLRATGYSYDPSGKVLWTRSSTAPYDTMNAVYDGLGQLADGASTSKAFARGNRVASGSDSRMLLDALGNRVISLDSVTFKVSGGIENSVNVSSRWFFYERGTGRLAVSGESNFGAALHSDTTLYDADGNEVFVTKREHDGSPLRDRASFYGADGRLRASEVRNILNPTTSPSAAAYYTRAFEEYRYDALGRRVWVRTRQDCMTSDIATNLCRLGSVRRTVWDGDHELYEIQMPGDLSQHAENDTAAVQLSKVFDADPNPFFGRVAYTYGIGIDQPLSIVRMKYVDLRDSLNLDLGSAWKPTAFGIYPVWNERGQPVFGLAANGELKHCEGSACARVTWPEMWFAYERAKVRATGWQGTLLTDKQDAVGTHYRRNRYYDPSTGRFTQEDPIGLAGGLNVYGFAAGDPVSYSDPYGLKIICNPAACAILRRVLSNARQAAASDNPVLRKAGQAVVDMITGLDADPRVVTLTAQRFSGPHRWGRRLIGRPFNPTDATGPCRGRDRYCPTGGESAASRVDLLPPPFSAVGAEVRTVHELGHAYVHLMKGVPWTGDSDQQAVDYENEYRTVKGCTDRASHEPGALNPPCMDN